MKTQTLIFHILKWKGTELCLVFTEQVSTDQTMAIHRQGLTAGWHFTEQAWLWLNTVLVFNLMLYIS